VVDLVLLVRPLPVIAAGRPDSVADAEQTGGEEIDVAMSVRVALRVELRQLEVNHSSHLLRIHAFVATAHWAWVTLAGS
jgi:hypothetical protein